MKAVQMSFEEVYAQIDELVFNVVINTPYADTLRQRWMDSTVEMTGRAGWNLMIASVGHDGPANIDYDAVLQQIETEMEYAPKRKQDVMNQCLVEIGIQYPDYRQRCIAIGERLGRLDNTPVPKGCVSSYAPEWIAAVLQRKERSMSAPGSSPAM